jgi:phosphosulfolactate synthase
MMIEITSLDLPTRENKPRSRGLTMMIDGGLPLRYFDDLVTSADTYIDFVKFGWGTSVVTKNLRQKIDVLRHHGVDHYFGGTLFEKHVLQDRFDDFRTYCHEHRCHFVEVSNGTIDLSNSEKAEFIRQLSGEFRVISEVGFKDAQRSEALPASRWVECIEEDLDAGACLVTLESRESGRSGICRPNGELRYELIEELLAHESFRDHLLFEAPSSTLQSYFIKRLGPDVNLGNIAATDAIGLETLRLGLRADTLLCLESERAVVA